MLAACFSIVFDETIDILSLDRGYQLELAAQQCCAYDSWHESSGGFGVLNEHKKGFFFIYSYLLFLISAFHQEVFSKIEGS